MFGSSEEDDQDVLLALLCKQLTEGKAGKCVGLFVTQRD